VKYEICVGVLFIERDILSHRTVPGGFEQIPLMLVSAGSREKIPSFPMTKEGCAAPVLRANTRQHGCPVQTGNDGTKKMMWGEQGMPDRFFTLHQLILLR
jgi:hypothetical protein